MPLLKLHVPDPLPDASTRNGLLLELSRAVAAALGKPEAYMQTCLLPGLSMTLGGSVDPTALAEISGIGQASPAATRAASAAVCRVVSDHLGIPADRIYVVFRDVAPHQWGWDGATFGD